MLLSTNVLAQGYGDILHAELGGGLQTPLYHAQGGHMKVGGGVSVKAEYRRFFNSRVGIGVGIGFSTFSSSTTLNGTETVQWTTPEGVHQAMTSFHDWREVQNLFLVNIPVAVYLQRTLNRRWSMVWGIGPRLDIPVNNEYSANQGSATRSGEHPNARGEAVKFGPDTEEAPGTLRRISSTPVGASLFTDLGFHYAAPGSLPVYFGVYFDYGLVNLLRDHDAPLYGPEYVGLFQSNRVAGLHTLSFGVKVGFSLNFSQNCTNGRCGFY